MEAFGGYLSPVESSWPSRAQFQHSIDALPAQANQITFWGWPRENLHQATPDSDRVNYEDRCLPCQLH